MHETTQFGCRQFGYIITRVKPYARAFKDRDHLLVVPQSIVVDNAPRDLKAKVKSSLRDCLCDIVKDGGGGVRPVANRGKRVRLV
jgi:hypothetical protein